MTPRERPIGPDLVRKTIRQPLAPLLAQNNRV